MHRKKTYALVLFLIGALILWSVFITSYGTEALVEKLGARNGYLISFLIAALSGVTTLTGVPHYTALVTLASGGLSPLLLGLIAGTGAMLGDMFFFYLVIQGKHVVTGRLKEKIEKVTLWLARGPSWLIPVFTYIYVGLTPLPADIMMAVAAFTETRYRYMWIADWLGNITLACIIAYGASTFSF